MFDNARTSLPAGAAGFDVYAGFWLRVAAALLDGAILCIPLAIVVGMFGHRFGSFVGTVTILAYQCHFLTQDGTTPGRRAVRIRVVTGFGEKPDVWTIVVRNAFTIAFHLPTLLFGTPPSVLVWTATIMWIVDVLWMNRHERWQTLHDRFAGTCVVMDRSGYVPYRVKENVSGGS